MAAPDTTGNRIPVALMADPFAHLIGQCATANGNFGMQDNSMNPLDMFEIWAPTTDAGIAVVLLNSLTKPLTLVDVWLDGFTQHSYPAIVNPNTTLTIKTHQIPGARPYPRPSKHPKGATMGGVGAYRFTKTGGGHERGALAFSMTEDGSSADPLIGVAFSYASIAGFSSHPGCVVADLNNHDFSGVSPGKTNLETLNNLCEDRHIVTSLWDISPTGLAVTGSYANVQPAKETDMHVYVVWVRDKDSTLGK